MRKKKEVKKDFMQGEAPAVAPQAPSTLDLETLKREVENYGACDLLNDGELLELIDLAIKGQGYDELEKERDDIQNKLDNVESNLDTAKDKISELESDLRGVESELKDVRGRLYDAESRLGVDA